MSKYLLRGFIAGLGVYCLGSFGVRTFIDHEPVLALSPIVRLLVGASCLVASVMFWFRDKRLREAESNERSGS